MALMFPSFFGGEGGVTTNRVYGTPFFGLTFGPQIQVYYLIAVYCFICTALMFAFTGTPLGRMLNAVRDNPERVEFIGYNTQRVRYFAFIIAGFFAGIGGGLAAINFEIVNAADSLNGAALGRLPAVHLPGRRDLLLRADHRRGAAGVRLGAAVGAQQGLAAVPGPGVPVHGDVRARRRRQPDHDEPARGAVRQVQALLGCSTRGLLVDGAVLVAGARGHRRDDLSHAAQRGARARGAVRRACTLDTSSADELARRRRRCWWSAWRCSRSCGAASCGPGARRRKRSKPRSSAGGGMSRRHDLRTRTQGPAQELRQDRDHPRRRPGGERRRAHRHHRPERRRQVDAVQPDQRPAGAQQRRGAAERPAHRRQEAVRDQPAGPVAQLPDHQHLPEAERVREPALRRAVEPGLPLHASCASCRTWTTPTSAPRS